VGWNGEGGPCFVFEAVMGAWGPVDFVRMDDVDVSEDVDVPSHKTRSRSSEARTQHYGERDGWICGICWWPIDPEYWRLRAGPRFDSLRAHLKPEVDHVIPVDWGGSDEDQNLQIAHAACNRHKYRDPQLPVDVSRDYLEWRLGLTFKQPNEGSRFRRPSGGSQRVALEAAVRRGEAGPTWHLATGLLAEDPDRAEQLFRRAAELGYTPSRRERVALVYGPRRDLILCLLFNDNLSASAEAATDRHRAIGGISGDRRDRKREPEADCRLR
jgi:hypothetical protein